MVVNEGELPCLSKFEGINNDEKLQLLELMLDRWGLIAYEGLAIVLEQMAEAWNALSHLTKDQKMRALRTATRFAEDTKISIKIVMPWVVSFL